MREWTEISGLFTKLIAQQPPFVQILVVLLAAFGLLMFVEGLRASFLPRRVPTIPKAAETVTKAKAMPQGSAVRFGKSTALRNAKRRAAVVKPHQAPRPKIRRSVSPSAEAAAAPLLPHVSSFEE